MKTITIKRNQNVINELFDVIGSDGFICGGFARYCVSPHTYPVESHDIDIYCKTNEVFTEIIERFRAKEDDWRYGKETPVSQGFIKEYFPPVQLIKPLTEGHVILSGTAEEIINNFDFTIARCAIISPTEAICDDDFEEDETHKKLRIKNIHCPIAQVYRISKYIQKGYWIGIDQVLKVMLDWENRDDEYKLKLTEFINTEELSKEDINELESLLHID